MNWPLHARDHFNEPNCQVSYRMRVKIQTHAKLTDKNSNADAHSASRLCVFSAIGSKHIGDTMLVMSWRTCWWTLIVCQLFRCSLPHHEQFEISFLTLTNRSFRTAYGFIVRRKHRRPNAMRPRNKSENMNTFPLNVFLHAWDMCAFAIHDLIHTVPKSISFLSGQSKTVTKTCRLNELIRTQNDSKYSGNGSESDLYRVE